MNQKKINTTRLIILTALRKNKVMTIPQLIEVFDGVGGISNGTIYPEIERLKEEKFIYLSSKKNRSYRISSGGIIQQIVDEANYKRILELMKEINNTHL